MAVNRCHHADTRLICSISTDSIIHNWKLLAAKSGSATTAAVIKADAYGHGMEQVGVALRDAGCRWFFTASLEEAVNLRQAFRDNSRQAARAETDASPEAPVISYFDGLHVEAVAAVAEYALWPSVNDPAQLALLKQLASRLGSPAAALLQLDTGMNRLGMDGNMRDWLRANPDQLEGADWRCVYSHLASADEPEQQQNQDQLLAFRAAADLLPGVPRSLANSAGIMLGSAYHFQLTRPGIALYGYPPLNPDSLPFRPAAKLHARILQIREAEAGAAIGYNATCRLKRKSRLATLAGGYADGWRRQLSNTGMVSKDGLRAPILGRISMDSHTIDITDWPPDHARVGDFVTLIGGIVDTTETADASGTIVYDLLTSLGLRASRSYAEPGNPTIREQNG